MKDIQETRFENELKFIQENKTSQIQIKTQKNYKNENIVYITIPQTLTLSEIDIDLILHIPKNYPFDAPKLYFKTNFIFPHLSDARDMLQDILCDNWTLESKLIDVIEKIPKFIIEYNNTLKEGFLIQAGHYYLGENYDMSLIESLPLYTKKIKERQIVLGKTIDTNKLLVISDIYFCLYEIDKKVKGNLILTFWSHIRALITIKRRATEDICQFYWRNKIESKKLYELNTIITNSEEIVHLILGKMECFGINYNISERNLDEKPSEIKLIQNVIDIEMVQNQIENIEQQVNKEPNLELVQFLMTLYEKAVDYYSAMNDNKYEYYTKKIQETLNTPVMNDFMLKDSQRKKEKKESLQNEGKNNPIELPQTKDIINKEEDIKLITPSDTSTNEIHKVDEIKKEEDIKEESKQSHPIKVEISNEVNDDPINVSSDEEEDGEVEEKAD